MKISERLNEALCLQVQHEFLNMAKYKIMESYFQDLRLLKLANKFRLQADEEYNHATKFIDYINKRIGGKYIPEEIPNPELYINSINDIASLYLETEIGTTKSISDILQLIRDEKSYIDESFILEMLNIQVTEEDEADEFNSKVSLVKDLLLFDATFGG